MSGRRLSLVINPCMQIYVVTEFAFSLGSVIFCLYFIAYWRPDTNIYDAYLIFATGSCVSVLLITQPLISCFLGLDRCLCLVFPFKNTKLWNGLSSAIIALTTVVFWVLEILFHIVDAYPLTTETSCRSFNCLLKTGTGQVYTVLRYITSIGSVIIGIALIKLFKSKTNANFSVKNTRLVVTTLLMAILFDFIPHFISFCFTTFGGVNLTKIIGPFSMLVSSINCCVCGLSYYKTFGKSLKLKAVTIPQTISITGNYNQGKR